jgi:SpoVK/Ycf46/Vps4 family AAA+-type ATPase
MTPEQKIRQKRKVYISGIPTDISESEASVERSRIFSVMENLLNKTILEDITITISTVQPVEDNASKNVSKTSKNLNEDSDELSIEDRARRYTAQKPIHTFEKLVFDDDLQKKLNFEIQALLALDLVHNTLKYKLIKPVQRRGLILGGEPGTGKTTIAHAIASKMKLPILTVTSAEIESKYQGESSKNLKAAFYAAKRDSAILHIEEADSLGSKRLEEVNTGSEQSINTLRNQLFSCLDEYPVPIICSTNIVESLDKALGTRLRYIHVPMPDEKTRKGIWDKCLKIPDFQLDSTVFTPELAKVENVSGREIIDAVEDAALKAVIRMQEQNKDPIEACLTQDDLLSSITDARSRRLSSSQGETLTADEKEEIKKNLKKLVDQSEDINRDNSNTKYVLIKDSAKIDTSI